MRWILTISLLVAHAAMADVVILDRAERVVVRYDRSYALLIGVSDYTAGWGDLPSVPGELDQVEEVLEEHGFKVTKVLDPTEAELRRAFEDFIDEHGVDASHRLLIFFAGHGYSRDLPTGRRGYLVPADAPRPTADLKGFLRKAVPMTQVETWARNIEAKHTLFVFDSCFSGAVLDVRGGEPPQPSAITAKMGRSVRQFLTAGSAGEEVPGKSVFTPAFVRALRGEADLVPDGYVTGTELGVYLDQKVRYPGQTPQFGRLRGYHEGDFTFRLSRRISDSLEERKDNALKRLRLEIGEVISGRMYDDIASFLENVSPAEVEPWLERIEAFDGNQGPQESLAYFYSQNFELLARSRSENLIEASEALDQEENIGKLISGTEIAFAGGEACACGFFPTEDSRRGLLFDGQPLGALASTGPYAVYFQLPTNLEPGRHELRGDPEVGLGGNRLPIDIIAVHAYIDQAGLRRGGSTHLRLEVKGSERPITFEVYNNTPQVVSLRGGDRQILTTSGGQPNFLLVKVRGVGTGNFDLGYEVKLDPCPCKSD